MVGLEFKAHLEIKLLYPKGQGLKLRAFISLYGIGRVGLGLKSTHILQVGPKKSSRDSL